MILEFAIFRYCNQLYNIVVHGPMKAAAKLYVHATLNMGPTCKAEVMSKVMICATKTPIHGDLNGNAVLKLVKNVLQGKKNFRLPSWFFGVEDY